MSAHSHSQLSPAEQERAVALTRMKWVATGLFLLMALLFVATFLPEQTPPWLPYVRAFSEAAMVGALADWFAVTALFRHPFGIPIPHTAIVPNNKDRIGESLAGFVERNFLTAEILTPKLNEMNVAARIGAWMERPESANSLSADLGGLLTWLMDSVDDDAVRDFLEKNLRSSSEKVQVAPLVSRMLGALTSANRHQQLLDSAVQIARQQLLEHRTMIRLRIEAQSPWWLPRFVDEEIYQKIIQEVSRLLDRIGDDPQHAARQSFNEATEELIASLAADPDTIARGEALKQDILQHPAVHSYLSDSWEDLKHYVLSQSQEPDSALRERLALAVQRMGAALQRDEKMQLQINGWVEMGTLHLLNKHRASLGSVISDTVKSWDTELTTRRVELQVGRDLQFIRINGTLVGGLVGVLIYSIVHALTK